MEPVHTFTASYPIQLLIMDAGSFSNRHHEIPLTDSMTAKQSEPTTSQVTLRNGLRNLSNREQQLLWLAYAEGFTHKEVANIMNLSENSVRVLLFRARHRLASALGHNHDSKGGI